MALITEDDVIALLGEHHDGIGLNAAINTLAVKAAALHPLPSISESIMSAIHKGLVELTADRRLRLT